MGIKIDPVQQTHFTAVSYTHLDVYKRQVHDPDPDELMPVIHDLLDGQSFDLGGGRMVTAYSCPGHTPGEMIFLDEQTRTLFAADALNFNLYLGKVSMETSLPYYKRMRCV